MNSSKKINDMILVICGIMYTNVSNIIFPNDFKSLNTLNILKALITVAAVDILIPSRMLRTNPISVPTTIMKSNLLHEE